MKYTITINQSAVFSNGLIHKTDIIDWAIIDYLKDFAIYRNARKIVYQGEEYIWLNYNHLIASLPLLQFKTKAALSKRINKLRQLELIKTYQTIDNTLFYTFTDKMIDICFARQSDITRIKAQNADPVIPKLTAQYKTKISIINKYTNRNTSSFSSSLKPKKIQPRMNTDEHNTNCHCERPQGVRQSQTLSSSGLPRRSAPRNDNLSASSAVKNIKGFTTMSGSVWKILADIKERQKISSMKNKQITRSNL